MNKKTAIAFYDHLSSNCICNFQDFSTILKSFSIFKDFSRPGNSYFHFPGFQGFPGCVVTLTSSNGKAAELLLNHKISGFTFTNALQSAPKRLPLLN